MNRLLPVVAILLLSAVSCQKKTDEIPPAPSSMQPTTANSTWSYTTNSYAPAPATGSYTLKATNKDTVVGSRTYRAYTNSSGQNDYFAQAGNDYYQLGSLAVLGAGTSRVEVLYLKDAAAGTTWSETQTLSIPGFPAPVNVPLNYRINKKGFDTTINGKAYKDVTHVKVTMGTINVSLGGIPFPLTPVSDLSFYYARGIGRIYSRTKVTITIPLSPIAMNIDDELILNSYTIQ